MSSVEGEKISESRYLTVQGEGFETYRDASIEMLKVEQALKLAALNKHIGINTTNSGHKNYPLNAILRKSENNYIEHGLFFKQLMSRRAYPANMVIWDPNAISETDSLNFSSFSQECAKYYREYPVAFSLTSSIDLLSAIHFEYSSMVRMILSMTIIEMLAGSGEKRTTDELVVIDELISRIQQSSLEKDQKVSLAKAVNGCKSYSIGNSCRKFIKRKLGKEQAMKFHDLYDLRSKLVHSGGINAPLMSQEDQEAEIYKSAGEAYVLARDLTNVMLEEYRHTSLVQDR